MDNFVKCFDAVSMVTDEATAQFSPLWKENRENKKLLAQYCRAIDSLSDEFGGKSFDVEVDDVKMTVTVRLECDDMTLKSQAHKYYDLVKRSVSFGFSASKSGDLVVEFVFPSIWERA